MKIDNDTNPSWPEQMPEEDDLEKILCVYIDRLNAGEILDRRAIFKEHPELADEILERLEVFQTVGASVGENQPLGTRILGKLGDYLD